MLWPFNKNNVSEDCSVKIKYSQLDITENFDDHLNVKPEDWIHVVPLNIDNANPEAFGLPSKDADAHKIYAIAVSMSKIRESMGLITDGVYCPVCHIANTELTSLHTPCPKCKRELLRFGWD